MGIDPEIMVIPMPEELTRLGVEELRTDRNREDVSRRHAAKDVAVLYVVRMTMLILVLSIAAASQKSPAKNEARSAPGNPMSGKQLFTSYCGMCHGADAKGSGPFSPQLKVWPPDLTQLAKRNNGTFPSLHVAEVIDGEFEAPAHGSREMPMWGPVFRSLAHGRQDSAQRRIDNLVRYLQSLQQK